LATSYERKFDDVKK